MDAYTPRLLDLGLKGMIGKGYRSPAVKEAILRNRAVYFAVVGGAAALGAQRVTAARVVAWDDLGPEAVRELDVVDFPVIVVNDIYGGDLYEEGRRQFDWRRVTARAKERGDGVTEKNRETANVGAGLWKGTGMWAWLLHRISGLVLVVYLLAHIGVISQGHVQGQAALRQAVPDSGEPALHPARRGAGRSRALPRIQRHQDAADGYRGGHPGAQDRLLRRHGRGASSAWASSP